MTHTLFIVSLKYRVSLEIIDAHRAAHVKFLDAHYDAGAFLISGPKIPRNGGIIMARCSSKEALYEILKQDPFMVEHLAEYEVFEFSPTKYAKECEPMVQRNTPL